MGKGMIVVWAVDFESINMKDTVKYLIIKTRWEKGDFENNIFLISTISLLASFRNGKTGEIIKLEYLALAQINLNNKITRFQLRTKNAGYQQVYEHRIDLIKIVYKVHEKKKEQGKSLPCEAQRIQQCPCWGNSVNRTIGEGSYPSNRPSITSLLPSSTQTFELSSFVVL